MPTVVVSDPPGISCTFSDGTGVTWHARQVSDRVLVCDLLSGLAGMVHPHGPVDAAKTVCEYGFASQRMRDELTADLQSRWEESLRERAAIDPHSSVPLLDTLLAPFRTGPARENTISQIPPNTATAPILRVG